MNLRERRRLRTGLAFTGLWIVGIGVFTAWPVLASFYYSFCDYSILKAPVWSGLENYRELVHDDLFWKALRNPLFYAGLSVPLGTVVALSLALLLNCEVRGRSLFRLFFYLPSIVPVVASAMLWLWIFNGQFGLLNWALAPLLAPFGLHPPSWLVDPLWAKPALIIMSLWGVGNAMVIYLAGLQDVPRELYEAASIDGATGWQKFRFITLPMLTPIIAVVMTFSVLFTFTDFQLIYVLTRGGPINATHLMATLAFQRAIPGGQLGQGAALASSMIPFLVASVMFSYFGLQRRKWQQGGRD